MRRIATPLVVGALLISWGAAPAGAELSDAEIQIVDVDASDYPNVDVIVDVPRAFADTVLTDEHFSLDEGGVPRELTVEKLDETTGVVLAIDTSGSMSGEPLSVAKASAMRFLDGVPESHPVAVVGFGDTVTTASGLTTDRAPARAAIESLDSGGETSLYDALVVGSDILAAATTDRFAIVLLSDGADTASAADSTDAVEALGDAGVDLYSIGLETGEARLTALSALTAQLGGKFLSTTDLADLDSVYDGLAARLANQYRLSFEASSEGSVRLQVVAASQGNLAVANLITDLATPDDSPSGSGSGSGGASEAIVDEIESFTAPATHLLEQGWVMWAGLGALFFAFSVSSYAALAMIGPKQTRRLEPREAKGGADTQVSGLANRAGSLVDRLFLDNNRRGAINAALDKAGLNVRPGEFVVLTGCVSIAVFVLGWVFHPAVAAAGAIGVALSARFVLGFLASRRQSRFADQLDNTLLVMASSLRAGHGIQRALAAVAEESESPTREEFARVVSETRIGRDLVEALQGVADRLGNEDFEWVVRAVAINRELGGNLSEVLDNVGDTIRERNQLRRQVSALSAEGKLSAIILYVLPFGVAGFIRMTNPSYLGELTESTMGLVAIALAIVLMIAGGAWIKKIVQVRF